MEKIEKIEDEKKKTEGKEGRRGKNETKFEMKEREEKRRSVIMKDIVLNRRKIEKTMENIMKDTEVEIIKRIRKIETGIEGKEEVLWVRLENERKGK